MNVYQDVMNNFDWAAKVSKVAAKLSPIEPEMKKIMIFSY